MLGKTPFLLRTFLGSTLACLGMLVVIVGSLYYPFIRVHAPPTLLGVALGLVAWLLVLAWRGYRIDTVALISGTAIAAVFTYLIRRPLVEMTLSSPLALVVGALAVFLYCLIGMRRQQVRTL